MAVLQTGLAKSLAEDYTIDQSLRFEDGDSPYLSKTFASAGNRKTWTYSCWVKMGNIGIVKNLLWTSDAWLTFLSDNTLYNEFGGGSVYQQSSALYRDPSAWYHVVWKVDTTGSPTSQIFVNGSEISYSTNNAPASDAESNINNASEHKIGAGTSGGEMDGYLAEVYFIDGQALTPSSFGETDEDTNQWKPIDASDLTFGTNGFYQKYASTTSASTFTDSSDEDHTIAATGAANTLAQKKVGTSSIYFDGSGDYLKVSDSISDFKFGTEDFCVEWWVRPSLSSSNERVWSTWDGTGSDVAGYLMTLTNSGALEFAGGNQSTGSWVFSLSASGVLTADTWQHIAVARSGTTLRVFVDGTEELSTTLSDADSAIIDGGTEAFYLGKWVATGDDFEGYLDEIRVSKGAARYTGSFTPPTTEFTPDAYTMLLIHSNWDGGLGADSSGNGNNFTVTNLVATDQMKDSPTNNFATLDPILPTTNMTYSEGNLKQVNGASTGNCTASTIGVSSGKWYAEFIWESSSYSQIGLAIDNVNPVAYCGGSGSTSLGYFSGNGIIYFNGAGTGTTYSSYAVDDVIGVALDLDGGTVKFYKNNSLEGTFTLQSAFTSASSVHFACGEESSANVANFGSDSSFAGNLTAQGNQDGNSIGDFYYEPPSGYLALCTDNLSAPEIKLPGDNFNTVLYTGTGASDNAVTGVGFAPDMVWVKDRTYAENHGLTDSVRGGTCVLTPDNAGAEACDTSYMTSLDSDGFTVGSNNWMNRNTESHVAWNWLGDGVDGGTLNEVGDIDSYVNVNTTAGFSIVKFTGNKTASQTVGHGLSQQPTLGILKNASSSQSWRAYFSEIGDTSYGYLDRTDAFVTSAGTWSPTASVFTVDDSDAINGTSNTIVAYCFHEVAGYSKIGTYTGNGNNDGTFIYTGFRPAYTMTKNIASAEGYTGWTIQDVKRAPYNIVTLGTMLTASGDYVEGTRSQGSTSTLNYYDILSNGFKMRGTGYEINQADAVYVYIAFAEYPFKYTNAR